LPDECCDGPSHGIRGATDAVFKQSINPGFFTQNRNIRIAITTNIIRVQLILLFFRTAAEGVRYCYRRTGPLKKVFFMKAKPIILFVVFSFVFATLLSSTGAAESVPSRVNCGLVAY
jgi:hypothetical protein